MTPRHRASPAAYQLIKRFEGLRRRSARVADGRWTVGYGHTRSAREGVQISAEDAEGLLMFDVRQVAEAVNAWTYAPLTQNQFDALVAFAFNIGLPAFRGSNVLRRLNAGEPLQAASAMDSWRQAEFEGEPQVIDALVRRRAAEKALFLTPDGAQPPVPTPVLPPKMDYGVAVLEARPVAVTAPLDGDPTPTRATDAAEPAPVGSATASAADAVAGRLRALIPDGPIIEPTAAPKPRPEPSPRPLAPVPDAPAAGLSTPRPATTDEAVSPPSDALAPTPDPATSEPADRWTYVLLFLGGAVLFVAGISTSMRDEGLSPLGIGLSLAGIACIGVSVYFLLKRIEAAED